MRDRCGDVDLGADSLISFYGLGVWKPAVEAYKHVLQRFGGEEAWFAVAHI